MIATPHLEVYTAWEDVVLESCWTRELAAKPAGLCEVGSLEAAEGWNEGGDCCCTLVCNFRIKLLIYTTENSGISCQAEAGVHRALHPGLNVLSWAFQMSVFMRAKFTYTSVVSETQCATNVNEVRFVGAGAVLC